jgi:hypothetical protein
METYTYFSLLSLQMSPWLPSKVMDKNKQQPKGTDTNLPCFILQFTQWIIKDNKNVQS